MATGRPVASILTRAEVDAIVLPDDLGVEPPAVDSLTWILSASVTTWALVTM